MFIVIDESGGSHGSRKILENKKKIKKKCKKSESEECRESSGSVGCVRFGWGVMNT